MSEPDTDSLTMYPLSAETLHDEKGPMVRLEQQEDFNDPSVIVVHPWQLRAACQHLGIVATDPEGERTAARLTRRLQSLAGRIRHLNDWLRENGASGQAGLTYGQTYAQASADLAAEFLADLGESRPTEPEQGVLL